MVATRYVWTVGCKNVADKQPVTIMPLLTMSDGNGMKRTCM